MKLDINKMLKYTILMFVLIFLVALSLYPLFVISIDNFFVLLLPVSGVAVILFLGYKINKIRKKLDIRSSYEINCILNEVSPNIKLLVKKRFFFHERGLLISLISGLIFIILFVLGAILFGK